MGLIDGDAFVSGDILSFQQAERMKDHFIQADPQTNLGNPQDGMAVVDSDDDKFYLYSGSAYEEILQLTRSADVDPSFNDIQIAKSVLRENLLGNSGFGLWSRSDANKGLGTLNYDTGDDGTGDIPDVGDSATGDDSGATGKIISMTIATGTFAGGNATGVITLGAVTGCFNDNEALSFTDGETAVVNHPDGAVGADAIVKNGSFATDNDPPNDWDAGNGATLTTEAAGQVGNCMMITGNGFNNPRATQTVSVTAGKIYKFTCYIKRGTEIGHVIFWLYDSDNASYIYQPNEWAPPAAWTEYTFTFEAPAGCSSMQIGLENGCDSGEGLTMYFDEITLYEITPCCTAANTVAFDGWTKDSSCDIYREHNNPETTTKNGSFYALKIVPTAASDYVVFPTGFLTKEYWYQQFEGRIVSVGMWILTNTGSHAKVQLTDGTGTTNSDYHTGGGSWEWLEVTHTISSANRMGFTIYADQSPNINGTTIVYVSQPMLVFGSYIGEGNYKPIPQEKIFCEASMNDNVLSNTTHSSTGAMVAYNLEAAFDARLPKGTKAVMIKTAVKDSGSSSTTAAVMIFQANSTAGKISEFNCGGLFNDAWAYTPPVWQKCDEDGDLEYRVYATGANTFDISDIKINAVLVN